MPQDCSRFNEPGGAVTAYDVVQRNRLPLSAGANMLAVLGGIGAKPIGFPHMAAQPGWVKSPSEENNGGCGNDVVAAPSMGALCESASDSSSAFFRGGKKSFRGLAGPLRHSTHI
jgi:hypothetical protein